MEKHVQILMNVRVNIMDVSTFAITIKEVISALVMTTISLAVTTKHVLTLMSAIHFTLEPALHFRSALKIVTIRLGLTLVAVMLDTHLHPMGGHAMMSMNVVQDLMAVSKHA